MTPPPERFYIPSRPTIIEGFRAMRAYFEKLAESRGRKLDPSWHDDGPETLSYLHKDQPTRKETTDE